MSKDTWQLEAEEMAKLGFSWRAIAKNLNKGKSTISDYLRKLKDLESAPLEEVKGAKILFIDVELKPIIGHVWRLFDQNVGINQIETDWSILSYCAKWADSDVIFYEDLSQVEDIDDDSSLLDGLWDLLNQADIIIGHNSKRFDIKKINARLILNGFPRPSSFRQIDTLEIAKKEFGFTSNKLEYLTDKLCSVHKKISHGKFPGHILWSECMKGNPEAWQSMRDYNIQDVLSLEELYNILSSWSTMLPNFDVYVEEILSDEEWEEDGFHYTNFGKYKKYRNKSTGVQKRSRVNLLTKEKRQSLLSNI